MSADGYCKHGEPFNYDETAQRYEYAECCSRKGPTMSGEKLVNDLERELRILCEMESQDRPKARYHAETRVGIAKAALLAHVSGLREQLRLEKADYLMSNEIVKDLRAENERLKEICPACNEPKSYRDATGERVLPLKPHKNGCRIEQLGRENAELRMNGRALVEAWADIMEWLQHDPKCDLEKRFHRIEDVPPDLTCTCGQLPVYERGHVAFERLKAALEKGEASTADRA